VAVVLAGVQPDDPQQQEDPARVARKADGWDEPRRWGVLRQEGIAEQSDLRDAGQDDQDPAEDRRQAAPSDQDWPVMRDMPACFPPAPSVVRTAKPRTELAQGIVVGVGGVVGGKVGGLVGGEVGGKVGGRVGGAVRPQDTGVGPPPTGVGQPLSGGRPGT
jgi:hypothetical protein